MKFLTNLIINAVIGFTLLTNLNYATNYYLDSSNGNDTQDGLTPETAWKTLQKLNNNWINIMPGDSILFKCGEVWMPRVHQNPLIEIPESGLHGTAEKPIVLGYYGKGPLPVISANHAVNSRAFYATNMSYVIIQDIEFRGDLWFYALLDRQSEIHHIKLTGIRLDGAVPGERTGGYIDFWAEADEVAPEVWRQAPMHDIEISYSVIRNTSSSGIILYGSGNNWVHHNKFYNIRRAGIDFAEGDNNIAEYNIISGAIGPGIKHSAHSHTANNIIIRGNLILNTDGGGICAYNLTNSKIYNNTIRSYNTQTTILGWTTQIPSLMCSLGKSGFDKNVIANNIFYGGPLYIWNAENVTIKYMDGSSIYYSRDDLRRNNIFQSNIIYNPKSINQIYMRYFTEGDDLNKYYYNELNKTEYISCWTPYDNNFIEFSGKQNHNESESIKITGTGNTGGAFVYLNKKSILKTNLSPGEAYTVSFWAKTDSKTVRMAVSGGEIKPVYSDVVTPEWHHYEIKFTASSYDKHFLRCSELYNNESIYLEDLNIVKYYRLKYRNSGDMLFKTANQIYSTNLTYKDYYIKYSKFEDEWNISDSLNNDICSEVYFKDDYWKSAEDYGDFSLADNSPALSRGVNIPNYNVDLLGTEIPQNTNPDIGAIQTTASITIPSPDTNKVSIFDSLSNTEKKKESEINKSKELKIDLQSPGNSIILYQNYPNPFNPHTQINYYLPQQARVQIYIINIIGEVVDKLADNLESAGLHDINWDGGKLASGIYYLVFHAYPEGRSDTYRDIKKMLIIK